MTSLGLYTLSLIMFQFPGHASSEPREERAERLTVVAQALADSAEHFGAGWGPGPTDLARAMVAAGGWGMGFKREVQTGEVRGPAGEVCLMDLLPSTLRTASPYDRQRLTDEELAAGVLGLGYDPQRRCFDAGALILVRARRMAERRCKGSVIDYSTFALFATGSSCTTAGMKNPGTGKAEDWLAGPRFTSLRRFRARKATVFPEWFVPPKEYK